MNQYEWIKASDCSSSGDCVEVMDDGFQMNVRNSSDPGNTILKFTYKEWTAFLEGVRNGEFGE